MDTELKSWTEAVASPTGTTKSRKRSAGDAELGERTSDKTRGRPRKSAVKDESAAERRRTQIRNAQRNYRLRQVSTIESQTTIIDELRERVAELTSTVEMMNRGLHEFARSAVITGLPTETKLDLDALVRKFAPHIATARNPSKPADDQDGILRAISAVAVDPKRAGRTNSNPMVEPENLIPIGMGYSMPVEDAQMTSQTLDSANVLSNTNITHFGPGLPPQKLKPQKRVTDPDLILTEEQQFENDLASISGPFLDTPNYEISLVPRSMTLPPVKSHAYLETSFSRRLQRRCCEVAFELLQQPMRAPRALDRIFALQLHSGRTRDAVMSKMHEITSRSKSATLDHVLSPFGFIGGAGMHYPDKSASRRIELLSTKEMDALAAQIPGLEGEWLDAADVEGYLNEQGVEITSAERYVGATLPLSKLYAPPDEADMDLHLALRPEHDKPEEIELFHRTFLEKPTMDTSLETSPFAQSITANKTGRMSFVDLGEWNTSTTAADVDLGSLNDLMDSPALNFFSIPGTASYDNLSVPLSKQTHTSARQDGYASSNSSGTANSGLFSTANGNRSTSESSIDEVDSTQPLDTDYFHGSKDGPAVTVTVTIDVEKLMKLLMLPSVCLGRTAGFRRKYVDMAIRNSVVYSTQTDTKAD